LIAGPRGVGKATLAWRIARFLLTAPPPGGLFDEPPPQTLDVDPQNPVVRRMQAGAEPRLFVLRRPWDADAKRLKREITVDEARKLKSFFALSSADGGRRVVIVDAADELNPNAANAILKILEEPPEGAVILMIAHQPSRLLPTIRSRCRVLRCGPLDAPDLAQALGRDPGAGVAELAQGSVGEAVGLVQAAGAETYAELIALFSRLPDFDRQAALKLAESTAARGAEARFDLVLGLTEKFLARLARTGAGRPPLVAAAPGEIELLTRLAPSQQAARGWADLAQSLGDRVRRGRAVNLDPAALILDMVLKIRDRAAQLAA
jgi:DNA polymerase-3 subunit delta'